MDSYDQAQTDKEMLNRLTSGGMSRLTKAEHARARKLARTDYEIRHMLACYDAGTLDDEGYELLLEEIS